MLNKNQDDFNLYLTNSSLVFKEEEALPPSKANCSTLLQFPVSFLLHHLPLHYVTFSISPPLLAFLLENTPLSSSEKAFF